LKEPVILNALALLGLILVSSLLLIWFGQRRVIYRPDTERVSPSAEGLTGVAEIELEAPDGAKLVSWFAPARAGAQTVLYFHGNGAGLADRSARIRILQSAGYGVLMLAYRGYAGSTGQPSEAANIADARRAYAWLRGQGVVAGQIVLFGESLGSGVAVQVAAEKDIAGVILDCPFTSLVAVVMHHFPYLPMRWLLRDRYMSTEHIGRVRVPLLIVHGEQDRVIPIALGRMLFELANQPKTFVAFPNVGHLVPFDERGWPVYRAFLEDCEKARGNA
jgi:uncharacterized protein